MLAARHLPGALFDNYDRCAAANERAKKLVRADVDLRARARRSARPTSRTSRRSSRSTTSCSWPRSWGWRPRTRRGWWRTSAGTWPPARRSWCGARGFLYPVVDPEGIGRGGFYVLAVHHPDDEVINSVIVARKVADDGHGSKCCKTEASAAAPVQARETRAHPHREPP